MTQRIILVRHAPALPRHALYWPHDSERPLSREGTRWFRRVVRGAVRALPTPDVVFSSPWRRAWETAQVLEASGWPSPQLLAPLAPGGEPVEVAAVLPADVARIALVGHEPDLGRLASWLLTGDAALLRVEVKKGAMISLDYDRAAGRATLCSSMPPRLLRRLG